MGKLVKANSEGLKNFIPEDKIHELLAGTKPDKGRIREIIQKSYNKNRLDPDEMAALLNTSDPELIHEIIEGSKKIKENIYGNRIVLFAPVYIGNKCSNDCTYCGFRCSNKELLRKTLTMGEIEKEIRTLTAKGHKRVILVYGEHPEYDADYIYNTTMKVYETKNGHDEIRRININAAPMDVAGFKKIKSAGIGTYQIFQETYHQETYKNMHPVGNKSDYLWRLYAFDRAMEAGIDDIGMGALIGLYDYKFESLAMLYHTIHLEEKFGVGPHTISFPRIEPAIGTAFADAPPHPVTDKDFMKMIACIRIAVPYTGMILTARESVDFRNEAIKCGVSQIDAGSNIGVGSYSSSDKEFKKSQFKLNDRRTLDEVVGQLCDANYLPSFCTGCYRLGRTGEHFMEFARPGFVKDFCTPNGVLTLLEYLIDYASPETKLKGLAAIQREFCKMKTTNCALSEKLNARAEEIKHGKRDLFF